MSFFAPEWKTLNARGINPNKHPLYSDQVSDAILDACLAEDPLSKVACETATKTGRFFSLSEGIRLTAPSNWPLPNLTCIPLQV